MKKLYQFLGSLPMAVILLVLLGTTLGFGTWCEAKYGTPAAQHFFYHALWFQVLLFLLGITLIISALHRLPWQKHHVGFVMTHLGIILILIGNLLGIWFGVEGQLFIPEGESTEELRLARDVLWVQPENPGTPFTFPLDFSARPWIHDVDRSFSVGRGDKSFKITVDRYFPNASVEEKVIAGEEEFPAVHLELSAAKEAPQEAWLFSRDPERFGFRWGDAHVLFFEVRTDEELAVIGRPLPLQTPQAHDKGRLRLEFPDHQVKEIPVESFLGKTVPVDGTPYTLSLKDYFPDFIITEEGPKSRSENPQNPAISFVLKGPEGEDAFLAFALHPEFEERHGVKRLIPVKATYEMATTLPPLPPSLIGVVRSPNVWQIVMTSPDGTERKVLPFSLNETYTHPWLDLSFRVLERVPNARLLQEFHLKDNDVQQQAIHVVVEQGKGRREEWIAHGNIAHVSMEKEMAVISYQPAQRKLPFPVKLVDFRKKEYPGTTVPSAFESDVEIDDAGKGIRLSKTLSMNHPFTYRGYTMFQGSFVEGPVETTVLAVRKDPGTPVVYTGFITVVVGVLLLFYLRTNGSHRETIKIHVR